MLPPDPKKLLHQKAAPDNNGQREAEPLSNRSEREPYHGEGSGGVPAAPTEPPAILSAGPSLNTILHALRRCWRRAFPVSLLGGFLAALVAWFLIPGQYTSTMVFRILSRPPQGSLEPEENIGNLQKAQVALMKSHDILSEAVAKSRAAELYGVTFNVQNVSKDLVTNFNQGPEVLTVQLSGEHPEAVAALLNALGEVYPQRVSAAEDERIKNRIAQLRRRLVVDTEGASGRVPSLAEQLRDKRIELSTAERKAGLFDAAALARKQNNADLMLQSAVRSLSDRRLIRTGLEAEQATKEKRLEKPDLPIVSDSEAEESLKGEADYVELLKEMAACRKKIDDLKRLAKRDVVRKLLASPQRELERLEQQRGDFIEDARQKVARTLRLKMIELTKKDVVDLKDKIDQAKKQEAALEAEVRRWSIEVDVFRAGGPKATPEVEALRDQVTQLEKEQAKVGEELAGLQGALPVHPRVTRHTEAFVPEEKDYGRALKFSSAAGIGLFGILLLGVCLVEARGRRVYASTDVMQGLGLRIVGTLPRLPTIARRKGTPQQTGAENVGTVSMSETQFGMIESVDAIRTVLLHAPRIDGARVVMITSATGGEGKTTLASHLAASLSRAWRKTLLIDGDLRNPAQHLQFDQPLEPGLCEALRGEVEIDDVVKPTLISRLWLLPAGKVDGHALEALAQDGLDKLFDRLKEQYDFIVMDTSPVLPVPDALLLGRQADAVLLAVMRDFSRIPAIYGAQQRLESLGIRILGAVVIGEKTESYGHAVPYPRANT